MKWNKSSTTFANADVMEDVYSDVRTPYSVMPVDQQDTQEFSMESIQQRLGQLDNTMQNDVVASTPDIEPSAQTISMSYQRDYAVQGNAAAKLSNKTKVAIAGYAVLVLALVLAVTLCSVSVSGTFGQIAALNSTYSEVSGEVSALDAQLAVEDYAALADRAAQLGYIDASKSNTLTYTTIETRPAQNFNVQTNWFDSLCDWLSGAFGG